jgi:hypothetical protein
MDLYLCYTTQHASNSDESRDKSPCPRGPQPTTFFNTDCLPSFEVTPATLSQMPSPGNSPLVLSALNSSASEAAGSGYSSTSSEGTPCLTVDPRQLFNPNRRIEQDPILPPPPYRDPNAPLVDLPFMDPSLEQCDWQGYLPPVPDHWMGEELSERKIASWRSPGEFIHICQVTGCNYMNFNPSLFR